MYVLKWAIEHATEISGPAIRDALLTIKDFRGAMNVYSYREGGGGDLVQGAYLTRNKGGKPMVIAAQS
jgi:hypothetical protein